MTIDWGDGPVSSKNQAASYKGAAAHAQANLAGGENAGWPGGRSSAARSTRLETGRCSSSSGSCSRPSSTRRSTRLRALDAQQSPDRDSGRNGGFVGDDTAAPRPAKMMMDLAFPAILNAGLVSQARRDWKEKTSPGAGTDRGDRGPCRRNGSSRGDAGGRGGRASNGRSRSSTPRSARPRGPFWNWLNVLVEADGAPLAGGRQGAQRIADQGRAAQAREPIRSASNWIPTW